MHVGVGDKLSMNLSRVGIPGYVKCVVYQSAILSGRDGFIIRIQEGKFEGGYFWLPEEDLLLSLRGAGGHLSFIPVVIPTRRSRGFFETQCLLYGGMTTMLVFDEGKSDFTTALSVGFDGCL